MSKIKGVNYVIKVDDNSFHPIRSVPIPGNLKGPEGKLVCWYGTRDTLSALKEKREAAKKKNETLYRVNFIVEGGHIPVNKLNIDDLPNLYFFNLSRLKVEVSDLIIEELVKRKAKLPEEWNFVDDLIGRKPELLNTFWESSHFKHVRAIAWPAPLSLKSPKKFNVQQLVAVKLDEVEEVEVRDNDGTVDVSKIQIIP